MTQFPVLREPLKSGRQLITILHKSFVQIWERADQWEERLKFQKRLVHTVTQCFQKLLTNKKNFSVLSF
jgi:hypothetical protein